MKRKWVKYPSFNSRVKLKGNRPHQQPPTLIQSTKASMGRDSGGGLRTFPQSFEH